MPLISKYSCNIPRRPHNGVPMRLYMYILYTNAQSLGKPYDKFSFSAEKQNVEDHLRMVHLKLRWPLPKPNRYFELITFMYNPDEK